MKKTSLISLFIIIYVSTAFAGSPKQGGTGTLSGRIMINQTTPMLNGIVLIYSMGPPPHPYKYWRIPDKITTTEQDGRFSMDLQEGTHYMMIAQKSPDGEIGPPSKDEFLYFHGDKDGNALPINIQTGKNLELGTLSGAFFWKADKIEREQGVTSASGVVSDDKGKPVSGVVVVAYLFREATGRPAFVSDRTDKAGKFIIRFSEGGTYFLKARGVLGGGRPSEGEFMNVTKEFAPLMINLKTEEKLKDVKLQVKMFRRNALQTTTVPKDRDGGNEFIPVPGGCFLMGNGFSDGYHLEKPVHEVCLDSFNITRFDVRVGEFNRFVQETGYITEAEKNGGCYVHDGISWSRDPSAGWRSPGFHQDGSHPVVCVSWNDADRYAKWRSVRDKRTYRLPSEAEWEYAARGRGRIERYAGGDDVDAVAWYSANSGNRTHPACQKKPNALGLCDMSGNVWQWTADWFGQDYYRESPRSNPKGPSEGTKRVFRGGSWFYDARGVRASYREFAAPDYSSSYLGFRLVLEHDDMGPK
jgi:formylglycine-generating enzyme required for sulfatase activity